MADPHQVNTIIATAICDCWNDDAHPFNPETAKQMAKCILAALEDAGLEVAPLRRN
jgi:hypothetical protein